MIGQTIAHYHVTAKLGAGGMGEVYRATDSKLGREVALKVLPEAFAQDAQRMARFQREAQVLASLNHPNIAAIYGLEDGGAAHSAGSWQGQVQALVMELVEGPTLAERIAAGAIPLDEALPIAKQIAEALEYAHEHGVIHRDLKPANIKLTREGQVKVLDFGLAKALSDEPVAKEVSDSPTLSAAATKGGIILGTAAYMSPEQARGAVVDKRADIWAFGVVLFEMLTGQRLFGETTTSDTLAAVLRAEVTLDRLPKQTPAAIRRLLTRCLEKNAKRRLRDIGEARILLEESPSPGMEVPSVPILRPARWKQVIPWSLTVLMTLVAISIGIWHLVSAGMREFMGRIPPAGVAHMAVPVPPTHRLSLSLQPALALSPDGTRLAYVASHAGTTQLYLRPLDALESSLIPGTEGASTPFFSADGEWVGFFADSKMKKVSLAGGQVLTVCDAPENRGATWGPDNMIIFTPAPSPAGLYRVPAVGGKAEVLTTPDASKGERSHRWPYLLPGGKAVLFTIGALGTYDDGLITVQRLDTGERKILVQGGMTAQYVPSGHLVYARSNTLLAVPFDPIELKITGPPVRVLEAVATESVSGVAHYAVSRHGSLAYAAGGLMAERMLVWVDRKGATLPLSEMRRGFDNPRFSPDGRRLAVIVRGPSQNVWVYEVERGAMSRLTVEPGGQFSPVWTPDGKRITYSSVLPTAANIFWRASDGSGAEERLATVSSAQYPSSWSPDGQVLVFTQVDSTTGFDIWMLRRGEKNPQALLRTPFAEFGSMVSPDGQWFAYTSNESGRYEVYVQPFPGLGAKVQISTEGGTSPVWARNGRELFFRSGDKIMAVPLTTTPLRAGAPRVLFEGGYEPGSPHISSNYDVTPDGQRFVMVQASDQEPAATRIRLVLNWSEELKRRVPSGKK